jgi:hypothetical protein
MVVEAEVLAHAAKHAVLAHDRQMSQGCRADGPQQNEYAPSIIRNLYH